MASATHAKQEEYFLLLVPKLHAVDCSRVWFAARKARSTLRSAFGAIFGVLYKFSTRQEAQKLHSPARITTHPFVLTRNFGPKSCSQVNYFSLSDWLDLKRYSLTALQLCCSNNTCPLPARCKCRPNPSGDHIDIVTEHLYHRFCICCASPRLPARNRQNSTFARATWATSLWQ